MLSSQNMMHIRHLMEAVRPTGHLGISLTPVDRYSVKVAIANRYVVLEQRIYSEQHHRVEEPIRVKRTDVWKALRGEACPSKKPIIDLKYIWGLDQGRSWTTYLRSEIEGRIQGEPDQETDLVHFALSYSGNILLRKIEVRRVLEVLNVAWIEFSGGKNRPTAATIKAQDGTSVSAVFMPTRVL